MRCDDDPVMMGDLLAMVIPVDDPGGGAMRCDGAR